tara:strand:+ start:1332 stop:1463 length:132 start_codon:yes stop_codon:yes gene_type:complete
MNKVMISKPSTINHENYSIEESLVIGYFSNIIHIAYKEGKASK